MSIWSRISTLVKSNINAMISKAEDPEKILNQLIIDMREHRRSRLDGSNTIEGLERGHGFNAVPFVGLAFTKTHPGRKPAVSREIES